MASSLPSAKSPNQTQLAKYQELINQGKAKKIATVTQDGRIVDRYILVKYTDGDWVPGNELDGISDTKLQEINDAAQANIAAQGRAHNSEGKQASFADKHDFHIVKLEDESLDDKDVSHKETLLGGIDHTSYHGASGGKTSDGITKNQKDILDFGKKRPADRTETREELKKLSDKTFVKFYQEAYKASPSSTHQELFKTALEKYVTKTVESYQFSLHGDDLATEMKELSKAAHLAFNPSEASPKEDWLETDAASHVGEADYATAIFKAIIVRGEDHGKFTAGHAFTTLITKVNEAWYEMKRENQIDADSVTVIDIPRGSSGVGSSHSPHGSSSSHTPISPTTVSIESYQSMLQDQRKDRVLELNAKKGELALAKERSAELYKETSYSITPSVLATTKAKEAAAEKKQLDEVTIPRLTSEIEELQGKIDNIDKLDFSKGITRIPQILTKMKENEARAAEVNTGVMSKVNVRDGLRLIGRTLAWAEHSVLGTPVIPYMMTAMTHPEVLEWSSDQEIREIASENYKLQDELDQILFTIQEETDYGWDDDNAANKMDAVYTRLQLFKHRTGDPIAADYKGALEKLQQDKLNLDNDFTDEELQALSEWAPAPGLDSEQQFLDSLTAFLTLKSDTQADVASTASFKLPAFHDRFVQMAKVKEVMSDIKATDYASSAPTVEHYKGAFDKLLLEPYYCEITEDEDLGGFDNAHKTSTKEDYAIHAVMQSIPGFSRMDPASQYQAILEELEKRSYGAIIDKLTADVAGVDTNSAGFTNWKQNGQKPQHFENALKYINGTHSPLTTEETYALKLALSETSTTKPFAKLFNLKLLMVNNTQLSGAKELVDYIDSGTPPYSTWVPAKEHFTEAREWLESFNCEDVPSSAEALYALKATMPTQGTANEKRATWMQRLSQSEKALEIATLHDDISVYSIQKQHLQEAQEWLTGTRDSLTPDAAKALQKIHADHPAPAVKPTKKFDHYSQHVTAGILGVPPATLDTRNMEKLWESAEAQLVGFSEDKSSELAAVPDKKPLYTEILRKLQANEGLNDLEKYTLQKEAEVVTNAADNVAARYGSPSSNYQKGVGLFSNLKKKTS